MPLYVVASLRVGHEPFRSVDFYRGAFFIIYGVLAFTRSPSVHKALAGLHLLLLMAFVGSEVILRGLNG